MPLRPTTAILAPDGRTSGAHDDTDLAGRIRTLEGELRELQHRAKNSLQLVISLLKLQAGRVRDPDARAAYEHTLLRIEALAILYRQLHESGSGTHIDLRRYIEAVADTVRDGMSGRAATVPVAVSAEEMKIGLYEAMPLGLIAAELITTSVRHAFPEDEAWVRVTLTVCAPGRGRMVVEDNGRPLPAGFDTAAEDGLMLAEALAAQLGDTLTAEGDAHGSAASVTFPLL